MSPWDIRVFYFWPFILFGTWSGTVHTEERQPWQDETPNEANDLHLFEQWLRQERVTLVRPERGDILEGTIVQITPHEILVDIGAKYDGIVPRSDVERLPPEMREQLREGQVVPVIVTFVFEELNEIELSIAQALQEQDWLRARELLEQGELVECEVITYNRGGLIVRFGQLRGFVPLSHVADVPRNVSPEERAKHMARLVGQRILLKPIEVDRARRRLIFSQREALHIWRERRKDELLATLKEGDIVRGQVRSFADFGVFVDLGGVDGLIHRSELAWEYVDDMHKIVQEGQEIEAMVIKVDKKERKIGLSLKRLQPNLWLERVAKYKPGDVVRAVITNVTDFGAFARIEEGVEGLIHASELGLRPKQKPSDVVQRGDEVNVKILDIDKERQRISLSLQQAPQWEEAEPAQAGASPSEEATIPSDARAAPEDEGGSASVSDISGDGATDEVSPPSSVSSLSAEQRDS